MKMIHMECPGHPDATLEGYILDCELSLGQESSRPAVIICPGGGYVYLSPREAEPVALSYANAGIHAFILRYSVGWKAAGFAPLEEISWAIGLLRENAAQWHINPDQIITCGFSAGGHVALSAGVLAENRPNAMILNYPLVSIPNRPGQNYMLKLLTGRNEVTDADAVQFDLLSKIDADTPPLFIAATAEDLLTGFGTLPVINRFSALGKPYEVHIFQHGPHGYSLANEAAADGSSQVLNDAYAQWQALSVKWLFKVFGQPQFADKSTSRMYQYLVDLGFVAPKTKGIEFA